MTGSAGEVTHDGCGLSIVCRDGVGVRVEREQRLGIALAVLDGLDVDAVAQEPGGLSAPEPVHHEVGEANLIAEPLLAGMSPP